MFKLYIGQTVLNLGQKATIIAFHGITGDLILEDETGIRWLADAAKCIPA